MTNNNKAYPLRMSQDWHKALKKLAAEEETTINAIILNLVENYLAEKGVISI